MKSRIALQVLVLLASLASLCAVHLLSRSWEFSARMSLLLHGHLSYQFGAPTQQNIAPARHANPFVHALVYQASNYIGSVDPYGTFIPASSGETNFQEYVGRTWLLMAGEFLCGLIVIIILADSIFLLFTKRHIFRVMTLRPK